MVDLENPGISLYYRIAEYIRNKILSKEWPEGYQLPSEMDLAALFKVSRSTIRQAIADLISGGYLERRRGVGTFVTTPIMEYNYIQNLLPDAFGKRHKVLSITKSPCTPALQRYLELKPNTLVTEIFRASYICDEAEPSLLERAFYESSLFPDLENLDLTGRIMYDYIIGKYNTPLVKAKTFIEPILMTMDEALVFHCQPNQLAQLLTRICYAKDGRPVILTKKIVRTDRFKLCVENEIRLASTVQKDSRLGLYIKPAAEKE